MYRVEVSGVGNGRDEVHDLRCRTGDIKAIGMISQVCKFGLEESWRDLNT
jgi:hypothetical protein